MPVTAHKFATPPDMSDEIGTKTAGEYGSTVDRTDTARASYLFHTVYGSLKHAMATCPVPECEASWATWREDIWKEVEAAMACVHRAADDEHKRKHRG